jgi:hypothetical protein
VRRLLAGWIVVALAAGVVVAVRDDGVATAHRLPSVLPVGFTLTSAEVAAPGATLATPLSYQRATFRRPGDRVSAEYVAAPADPDALGGSARFRTGRREPFGDGVAFVDELDQGTSVWWSTSRRSGILSSTTVGAEALLTLAHRFARSGFAAPPGWKGLASYDVESAVEALQYRDPGGQRSLDLVVHLDRPLVRIPVSEVARPYAQRRIGKVVITAVGTVGEGGLTAADLRAVVDSVRRVDGGTWDRVTAAAELDGRPVRWTSLAEGQTSTNTGWSLAVEHRGGQACPTVLVVEQGLGPPQGRCHVVNWRTDPVLAVPTDRSGPVTVTANGRALRALGEARFEGRRILVVELPPDLVGQILEPLAVVSRR